MSSLLPLDQLDTGAFARELDALRCEVDAELSQSDLQHLRRALLAGRASTLLGYATAWIAFNPFSAVLLSFGTFLRWAIAMHHIGHRGYDRVPGVPNRLTSRQFARGWRRWIDWLDWMPPEAWLHEHNLVHHARTSEEADPDLVQRNLHVLRTLRVPLVIKYLVLGFYMCTWKFTYYLPSVLRALQAARARRAGRPSPDDTPEGLRRFFDPWDPNGRAQWRRLLNPLRKEGRELWLTGVLPYAGIRFGLLPLLFLPLGHAAALAVLLNSLLAEALTNIHSFVVITPNHAGDDVAFFERPARSRAEYYVHQVTGSVNYTSSGEWTDWLQGGLNFQIEHHLWPDLPLSRYREISDRVRAICEKHGVPYRKEPLRRRFCKLVDVFVGRAFMATVAEPRNVAGQATAA